MLRVIHRVLNLLNGKQFELKTASFEEIENALQSGQLTEASMLQVAVSRPDYLAWHKQQTRSRLEHKMILS